MKLADYYRRPHSAVALAKYGAFIKQQGWPLEHKVEMYNHSMQAFGTPHSRSDFDFVYRNLAGSWQVFRGVSSSARWSSDETFDFFTRPSTLALRSLSIRDDWSEGECTQVLQHLEELRELKQTSSSYPWMAVSKFMHFFNPRAFPIYDTAVVYYKVFKAFRHEYNAFVAKVSSTRGINYSPYNGTFNLIYPLWASQLIRGSVNELMSDFDVWFNTQLRLSQSEMRLNDAETYLATAFEFIAIGAAIAEGY